MLADITSDERGVGEGELLRHGQPLRHLLLSFFLPFSLLSTFPRITSTAAAAVASLRSAAAELGFLCCDGREETGPRREKDGDGGGATREQQQRGLRDGDRRRGQGEVHEGARGRGDGEGHGFVTLELTSLGEVRWS
jgi:hypothetical protein